MLALLLLVPATAIAIAGYFALYLSHRSDGTLKSLGKYLGIWAFVLAVLLTLMSIVGVSMRLMHGHGHGRGHGFGHGFGMMHRCGPPPFRAPRDLPPPPPPMPGQAQPEAAPATPAP